MGAGIPPQLELFYDFNGEGSLRWETVVGWPRPCSDSTACAS